MEDAECAAHLDSLEGYLRYPERVERVKRRLLRFLIDARDCGLTTVAYGAPAKGNTLLNYCGIRDDLIDYTVDRSPHKQGHFLPGTHLPIYPPVTHPRDTPDYLLILPWNLKDEIMREMSYHPRVGRALRRSNPRAGRSSNDHTIASISYERTHVMAWVVSTETNFDRRRTTTATLRRRSVLHTAAQIR